MKILDSNIKIFKKIFNWIEIPEISNQTIPQLSEKLGIHLSSDEVLIQSSWLHYREYQVLSIDKKPLFHIKRLWESGSVKEILGLEIGRLLDPDLSIPNYVFGIFTSRFFHQPIPFVLTPWIQGKPIKKNDALEFAFSLGCQYEYNRWLCLYDCEPRHYFLQPDRSLRRIDFGLSFFHLKKKFEGFADLWPKELFNSPEFKRGIRHEHQKIQIRFEILEKEIWNKIKIFSNIKLDDFCNVRGYLFLRELKNYWIREGFIEKDGKLKKRFRFLHSPIITKNERQ